MDPEPVSFSLHVLGAVDLPLVRFGNLPEAYVKLQIDDLSLRTQKSAATRDPVWNETFQISVVKGLSSTLSFQVKHKALFRDGYLGFVQVSLRELAESGKTSSQTTLKLMDPDGKVGVERGSIRIRFVEKQAEQAAQAEQAEQAENVGADVIGVTSESNVPTKEVFQELRDAADMTNTVSYKLGGICAKLDVLIKMVDQFAKVHPYLNMAWAVTSSLHRAVMAQLDRDVEIMKLVQVMEDIYSFADAVDIREKIKILEDTIMSILQQTVECVVFIREYSGHGFAQRAFTQPLIKQSKTIKEFTDRFRDLRASMDSAVGLQTAFVSIRTSEGVERLLRNQDLQSLQPAAMDASQHLGCQPDTRLDSLKFIAEMLIKPSGEQNVLWLYGIAGCGKSTIATTVANYFRNLGRLGAFLFFSRAATSEPSYFMRTLAYQLGTFDPRIGNAMSNAISRNSRIGESPLRLQFTKLILEPLSSVEDLRSQGPIVVVLDALDECGDSDSRRLLLRTIAEEFHKLPRFIRIFVTSRPQHDITLAFANRAHILGREFEISGESNFKDIISYLRHRTAEIRAMNDDLDLEPDWPGEKKVQQLSDRSAGLFVWCSTAMIFVEKGHYPDERLEILLQREVQRKAVSALDDLYVVALQVSGLWDDDQFGEDFRAIMGAIIVARELLYHDTIDNLLGYETRKRSRHTLQRFGCVLSWVSPTEPVRILHPSFADFLTDRDRCKRDEWYIDPTVHNCRLVLRCLKIMEVKLTFNMCSLETSYLRNRDFPNIDTRIREAIPSHVSYACRFWGDHLKQTPNRNPDIELQDAIKMFLFTRLLYWLEALSLLKDITLAAPCMVNVAVWVQKHDTELSVFAEDARKFITTFQAQIAESAPHIYLSALPFSPSGSKVFKQYRPQFLNTISVSIGQRPDWPAILNALEGHSDIVSSIAFSPSGKRVVSGSYDTTVRIWNVESGIQLLEAFNGHRHRVTCVAFSPDAERVASGSGDSTVRIWKARTGELAHAPLEGHVAPVASIAYSPDGKRIASASWDKTILIWNCETGKIHCGPIIGHEDWVTSVSYSPDGRQFVSGSRDKTIRIWDSETGRLVSGPFRGHVEGVTSVTFTPDGKNIISGSRDKTIRIWDAKTGKPVIKRHNQFTGHEAGVTSVAISPDGTRIASGSWDKSLRVWNAETGELLAMPFKAHVYWISSVVFSPNGKLIASGSENETVQIWDAETMEFPIESSDAHSDTVRDISLSPDGKRIASASRDVTVRVWDAETGKAVSSAFTGHKQEVVVAKFSPDGKYIASGSMDKTIRIIDADNGQLLFPPITGHEDHVTGIVFLPDGKRIVSCSNDTLIRVWEIATGHLVAGPFEGHTAAIADLQLSPDGSRIVSGSLDKTVRIWDVETGKVVCGPLEGNDMAVEGVAFSPDGRRVVSCGYDNKVRMWDSVTGEMVLGPFIAHSHPVHRVVYSPDGKYIATGSRDGTCRLWDAETGALLSDEFEGYFKVAGFCPPTCVRFSSDGKRIISTSEDSIIRIWELDVAGARSEPSNDSTILTSISKVSWTGGYNGWICGNGTELVLWVPPENRKGLWRAHNTAVIGQRTTKIDFSKFAHGTDWAQCHSSVL